MPYPMTKTPLGILYPQKDMDQIKSDLLVLLLTHPGERVMLPDYGTPLRSLLFELNDDVIVQEARRMIIDSIRRWEPRIAVNNINITTNSVDDIVDNDEHILKISIEFVELDDIQNAQVLELELPLNN